MDKQTDTTKAPAEERADTWFKMAQTFEGVLIEIERIATTTRQEIGLHAHAVGDRYSIPVANLDTALALISAIRVMAKHPESV